MMLASCTGPESEDGAVKATSIQGTASYRERIALPPGAVLEVTLQDVSLADAPAMTLGSVRLTNPGSPPFAFKIPYDPGAIDDRHSYAVRATIRVGESLLFTTDTMYPVLTRGADDEVEVIMIQATREPRTTVSNLEGTRWKLVELGGAPAPSLEADREPHIVLDPTSGAVGGTGGCNRISGGYAVDGASISFGQLAITNKACFENLDVDRQLADALEAASGFRLAAGQLELVNGEGTILARFEESKAE